MSWCQSTSETRPPVTCIIADGFLDFAIDVAEELRIPIMIFHAESACSLWTYFWLDQLIEAREIPFNGLDFILHLFFSSLLMSFLLLLVPI